MKKRTPKEIADFFEVQVDVSKYGAVDINDGGKYDWHRFSRFLVDYTYKDKSKSFFPKKAKELS